MRELEARVAADLDRWLTLGTAPVALAVSGGSDSLALLFLVLAWARRSGRPLVVLTVDHRLRPEAAREAAFVGQLCREAGTGHRTLVWTDAPGKASPARARRARHALLASAARAAGASHLLLAHTEDDQAETVLMRERSGSGPSGFAGMRRCAMSPVWPEGRDVLLMRPCLDMTRAELQGYLAALGEDWVRDPTNDDMAHERVRVRAELRGDPALKARCLAISREAGKARRSQDMRLAGWLGTVVECGADGLVACDLAALDRDDAAEAMALVLMAAAGGDRRPAAADRTELAGHLAGPSGHAARTLGGAWAARRHGRIHVSRDPGGAARMPQPGPDFTGIWDGRFEIGGPGLAGGLSREALLGQARPMARPGLPPLSGAHAARCLVAGRLDMARRALASDANIL